MDEKREQRKHEHIYQAIRLGESPLSPGWEDISLVHQALPSANFAEIDTSIQLFKKKLQVPLIINALTGGSPELAKINTALALVAKEAGIGLAVGSQMAAIKNKEVRHSYETVRKVSPQGLIMANISALANSAAAQEAVEMVEADALQLHLNAAQELLMPEGDRDFRQMTENIGEIVNRVKVPVLVKEVGFGLARETANELYKLGVAALDISGAGGTNFAAIELLRSGQMNRDFFQMWGIPAAASLLDIMSLKLPIKTIASGGIANGLEIMKVLALGAEAAGIAGAFLKILMAEGEAELSRRVRQIKEDMQILMLLTGASKISEIAAIPLVISGATRNWCEQRNIDTQLYGNKR